MVKKGNKYNRERWRRMEVGVVAAVCVCGCLAFMLIMQRMDEKE